MEVAHLCKKFDIVALLEVHGPPNKIKLALSVARRTHDLFCSQFIDEFGTPRTDAGGVCLLVSKGLTKVQEFVPGVSPNFASGVVFHDNIAPGRVVKLEILGPKVGQSLCGYFVHNHNLSPTQMSSFENCFWGDCEKSWANPNFDAVFLMGDFNLIAMGDRPIKLDAPLAPWAPVATATHSSMGSRPMQSRWQKVFDAVTEIKCPLPSHVCIADLTMNKIDRVFSSLPKSSLNLLKHDTGVIKDPVYWYSKFLSDHAPCFWKIHFRAPTPSTDQKIKPE